MQEEIRIMTLVRKSGIGENEKLYGDHKDRYFTTDYFDVLITKKETVETPLSQWMCENTVSNETTDRQ